MVPMSAPRTQPLLEADVDPDPLRQFESWLAEARRSGVPMPEAMVVATATSDGAPSARFVLLRGWDARGFVFYTSYASRKGRELEENPRAALLFGWDALGRQVRIEGVAARVAHGESEAYFASRPRGHRLAAWASAQSFPVSHEELNAAVADVERRFAGTEVPLPPSWGGYRVTPGSYEFWQHRENRLHDRLRYRSDGSGGWALERLAP
jgi:pyridoxamine 5'-phosphate oxidase